MTCCRACRSMYWHLHGASLIYRSAMSKLFLYALPLICTSIATAADGEHPHRCRISPKLIVANSKSEDSPPSTAMPPVGTVVLEVTVATDGTVRDVLVVEPVDIRLRRWAIEKSKTLRFEPVSTACTTRLTLESRIADGSDGS